MAHLVPGYWPGQPGLGVPRRLARPCQYEAYVPDLLAERRLVLLSPEAAGDLQDAEQAIKALNESSPILASLEAVARLFLRAEAVASSRIEGLEVGAKRLVRAEAARVLGEPAGDVTAEAVLGNVEAMRLAVDVLAEKRQFRVEDLLETHRVLMQHTQYAHLGGVLRTTQNWIGGNDYNPCGAEFVPPPPELVPPLLEDLVEYLNGDQHFPLIQAALAHLQFETIHPFSDGNGRVGRTLIHVVLKRRGLAPRYVPPISLILATRSREYVAGLTAARYVGDPNELSAIDGSIKWLEVFGAATIRACADAERFGQRIDELVARWRAQAAPVRTGSAVDLLIRALPAVPVITITTATQLVGRSFQAVSTAVERLVEAGVLIQTREVRRNRAFEAVGLIDLSPSLRRPYPSRPRGRWAPAGGADTGRPSRRCSPATVPGEKPW